jgi:hypothetical protein
MSMPDIRRTIKYATNLARLLTRLAREVPTIVRKSSRPVHAFIHFFTYSLLHSFTSSLNHFITQSLVLSLSTAHRDLHHGERRFPHFRGVIG